MLTTDNDGTPNVPNVVFTFNYNYAGQRTGIGDNLGGYISSSRSRSL